MALLVDHEPLLVVTRGDQRVDMHKARSSASHSSLACSRTHSAGVCRDAAHAEPTRRVQSAAFCAAHSMSTRMQEMHHPAHSGSRWDTGSSSGRMLTDSAIAQQQLRGAVCLARYTPPVAAAAALRVRLLRMV
jgi:hypothetical protein